MKISYVKKRKGKFHEDKNKNSMISNQQSSFRFIHDSTMGHFSPNSSNVLDLEDRPSNSPEKKIKNGTHKDSSLNFSKKNYNSEKKKKYANIVESIYFDAKNKSRNNFNESKNKYESNQSNNYKNSQEINKTKNVIESSKIIKNHKNFLEIKSEKKIFLKNDNLQCQLIEEKTKNLKLEKEIKNLLKDLDIRKNNQKKIKKLLKEEKEKFKKLHNILLKKEDNNYKREYKVLEKKNNELLEINHDLECKLIKIKKNILSTSNLNNVMEKDFNLIKNQYTQSIKSKNQIIMELEKKNNILKKKLEILQKNNISKTLFKEIDHFSKKITDDISQSKDLSHSKNYLLNFFDTCGKKKNSKNSKNLKKEQKRFSQKNYFDNDKRSSYESYKERQNKTFKGLNDYMY